MATTPSVSAVQMYDVFDALMQHGMEASEVASRTGLDPAIFRQVDGRIPADTSIKLWDLLWETSNDPLCALKIGQIVRKQSMGVVGNLFLACNTLGEALDQSIRFHSLTNESGKIECFRQGKNCLFRYSITDPRFDSHLVIERSLSSGLTWANFFTGKKIEPLGVFFEQPEPEYASEVSKFFGCPVHYGQDNNEISQVALALCSTGGGRGLHLDHLQACQVPPAPATAPSIRHGTIQNDIRTFQAKGQIEPA